MANDLSQTFAKQSKYIEKKKTIRDVTQKKTAIEKHHENS